MEERPEEFAEAVVAFLQRTCASGGGGAAGGTSGSSAVGGEAARAWSSTGVGEVADGGGAMAQPPAAL